MDSVEPTQGSDPYRALVGRVQREQGSLLSHPLYNRVSNLHALRVFMANHIFAVWDFMTLVKSLQRSLTCVEIPWLQPRDILSARLINDIVLGEETDEVEPGLIISHYELYLRAMADVGADAGPMRQFEAALREGVPAELAAAPLPIPESTRAFVLHTLRVAQRPVHEVAAAFLLGREDVIPAMFRRILTHLDRDDGPSLRATRWMRERRKHTPEWAKEMLPTPLRTALSAWSDGRGDPRRWFRIYLERHIELDEGHHAPMGRRLLRELCGDDPVRWEEATEAARQALQARLALWDGVLELLVGEHGLERGRRSSAVRTAAPVPGRVVHTPGPAPRA